MNVALLSAGFVLGLAGAVGLGHSSAVILRPRSTAEVTRVGLVWLLSFAAMILGGYLNSLGQ
jgi:hypothetical protein